MPTFYKILLFGVSYHGFKDKNNQALYMCLFQAIDAIL